MSKGSMSFFLLGRDLWLQWPVGDDVPGDVWMRYYEEPDGRWRIGTVVIDTMPTGDADDAERGPITRQVLSAVPVRDAERFIQRGLAPQAWGLKEFVPSGWPHGDPVEMLRQRSKSGKAQAPRRAKRYRLSVMPPNGELTDAYLSKVVKAYLSAVEHGLAPSPTIAADTGAQVRTVRSWIHKARQRGLMPPGVRGSAG